MNERLHNLYESARDGESERYSYIDYCNTRISACVAGEYAVEVTRYAGGGEQAAVFDVRNLPPEVFLDRVATWLVTGEMESSDGPSDPLEW